MKKLLVVIDYQVDFVVGSLGFPGAERLEELILKKIEEYRRNGDEIIYTLDSHYENYLNTIEGKNLPVEHCILGTKGHEVYGRVKESLAPEKKIIKHSFGSMELGKFLEEKQFSDIEFCGLVSNICVLSNMVIAKAASPESRIFLHKMLTASYDFELQEKAFDILRNLHIEILD